MYDNTSGTGKVAWKVLRYAPRTGLVGGVLVLVFLKSLFGMAHLHG